MDLDEYEEDIRLNAVSYSIIAFKPQTSTKQVGETKTFEDAIKMAYEIHKENSFRSVLIYAVNETGRFVLNAFVRSDDMKLKIIGSRK
jgi:hypothetical protein